MILQFITILFAFTAHCAKALPINEKVIDPTELCMSKHFRYFQPHPNNASLYFQCDPWGNGTEKSCESGKVWNDWNLKCDLAENLKNLTLTLILPNDQFDCSSIECKNDGVCDQGQCLCTPDFSGDTCETLAENLSLEILNKTFNVNNFKRKLIENKLVVDIKFYEKYKDQLDSETYSKLMNYLSLYKSGDVRFDALINKLIERILEDVYPDAEYLTSINASVQPLRSLFKLMPSLLSYSRYSFERYEQVFGQYKKVLIELVGILDSDAIEKEANEYKSLTLYFLNQTSAFVSTGTNLTNKTIESMQLDQNDVLDNLRVNYNLTVANTEQLFLLLDSFHVGLMNEFNFTNASMYELTLEQTSFDKKRQVFGLFTDIVKSSVQIWDSLLNYGFWFVTNMISESSHPRQADLI